MTEEAKEARRAYRREWAKNNPEKIKEHQARYWEKKAETIKQREENAEENR